MKAFTLIALCALGQCWPPVIPATVVAQVPQYEWKHFNSDPGRAYLYQAGNQVGAFDLKDFYFRPYNPSKETWGDKCNPPIEPHCFGVNHEKIAVEKRQLSRALGESRRVVSGAQVRKPDADRTVSRAQIRDGSAGVVVGEVALVAQDPPLEAIGVGACGELVDIVVRLQDQQRTPRGHQ